MDSDCSDSQTSDDEWKQAWDLGPQTDTGNKSSAAGSKAFHESSSDVPVVSMTTTINKEENAIVSRMQLNDNKAGMEGLDKERINTIIYEASKGSKYYENELKKEAQVNRRVMEQRKKLDTLSQEDIHHAQVVADELLEDLEKSRDLTHSIVHIDMDAFYAAVETRDRPELKDKPMAVGGNSMLSTSNYVARKYGVRAAMPGFIGKKLCPQLVIVPTNFDKYTAVSKQVREIMAEYDPNYCPMSLDEAYLNMSDHVTVRAGLSEEERSFPRVQDDVENCVCRRTKESTESGPCSQCGVLVSTSKDQVNFGLDVEEAVREMRHRIHLRTRLTASAGIAPNTMLAKVCSDKNKPNGQYRILPDREEVMSFVKNLPIRKVSGIGKVSEKMLSGLGVVSCTDLYLHRGTIYHLYSTISFNYFMRITLGLGSTHVSSDGERKSVSTERTFSEISKPEQLYSKCEELCQALTEDLHQQQTLGKTVTLKIKTVKYEVKTRAHTLADYTCDYHVMNEAAKDLLRTEIQACEPQPLRLRLMGVRLSNLMKESEVGKKRQNTITSFLKKHPSPRKPASSSPSKNNTENLLDGEMLITNQPSPNKVKKSAILDLFNNQSKKPSTMSNSEDKVAATVASCTEPQKSETSKASPTKALKSDLVGLFNNMSKKSQSRSHDGLMSADKSGTGNCGVTVKEVYSDGSLTQSCDQSNTTEQTIGVTVGTKGNSNRNKRKSMECVECPVCHRLIKSSSMKVITEHIEYCLVKQAKHGSGSTQETLAMKAGADNIGDKNTEHETSERNNGQSLSGELSPGQEASKGSDCSSGICLIEEIQTELKGQAHLEIKAESLQTLDDVKCGRPGKEFKEISGLRLEINTPKLTIHPDRKDEKGSGPNILNSTSNTDKTIGHSNSCDDLSENKEQSVHGRIDTETQAQSEHLQSFQYSSIPDIQNSHRTLEETQENRDNCNRDNKPEPLLPVGPSDVNYGNHSVLPDKVTVTKTMVSAAGIVNQVLSNSAIKDLNGNIPSTRVNDTNDQYSVSSTVVQDQPRAGILENPPKAGPSADGSDGTMTEYICPICNVLLDHPHLTSFNKHVDNCLSRQTIREILKAPDESRGMPVESSGPSDVSQPPSQGLKRSPSVRMGGKDSGSQSHKRRKLDKGLQTLESFMKAKNS